MRYLLLLLILSVLHFEVHSQIRFTKIVCKITYPTSYYEKCYITSVNRTTTALSMEQRLLETIHSVYMNVSLIQLGRGLNRVLYAFNNIDTCAFLLKRRNPVLRILFSYIQKYSNVNHSCPYKDALIISNLTVGQIYIAGAPMIKGDYELRTAWKLNGVNASSVDVSFHLD